MEVRPNTGFLMKNLKKEQDSQPDFNGTWTDEHGHEYYLSAWLNTSQKTGNKYFKLSLGKLKAERGTPVRASKPKEARATVTATDGFSDLDNDIPF